MINQSGVYEIVNTVNGKRYIGSAVQFKKRFAQHRQALARGDHHSIHLQRAWNKHGAAVFTFRPLLVCSQGMLLYYEQRAFDVFKPEYNRNPTANSSLGVKRTDATKAKLIGNKNAAGCVRSVEERAAMSERMLGTVLPSDVRQKISKSLTGVKHPPERCAAKSVYQTGKTHSPEWCANISKGKTGKRRSPCTDEARMNMSVAQTKRMAIPAKREEISKSLKAYHAKRKEKQP